MFYGNIKKNIDATGYNTPSSKFNNGTGGLPSATNRAN